MAVIALILVGLLALLMLPTLFRSAKGSGFALGGWSFRPSPFGIVAIVLIGILISIALWRWHPGFLFLPIFIPFFWTWRRKTPRPQDGRRLDDGTIIDASSRASDS